MVEVEERRMEVVVVVGGGGGGGGGHVMSCHVCHIIFCLSFVQFCFVQILSSKKKSGFTGG